MRNLRAMLPLLPLLALPLNASALSLKSAEPNRTRVPKYGLFQLTLPLHTNAQNPFDPKQIEVEAGFSGPNGEHFQAAGFLYQPYTSSMVQGKEQLAAAGPPVWLVRFAPNRPGKWRYSVTAKDASGMVRLPEKTFVCTPSQQSGPVQRNAKDPYLFQLASGAPYIPIGENMCWSNDTGIAPFQKWMPDLHAAGGNWIRLWMTTWQTGIEWSGPKPGDGPDRYSDFHGLGYYNLAQAWRLGRILDTAAQNHIRVMLCLGTYGEFTTGGYFGEGMWPKNPYNSANGGPCAKPDDFWTNPSARAFYRQRLRYLAARYGWRSHLFAWEFFNEVNAPTPWVAEMSSYLKGAGEWKGQPADPYRHLVSISYGDPAIWKLPTVDFSMTHSYGTGGIPDWAPVVRGDAQGARAYGKPHLMAEFGIDWRKPDAAYDPKGLGINLHNAIWASLASGNAGSAMIWWWDNYIAPENLYPVFRPLNAFAASIPWNQGVWQSLSCTTPRNPHAALSFQDLTLGPSIGWYRAVSSNMTILPDGRVQGGALPTFLFSAGKPDLRTVPQINVHFSRPGQFIMRVAQVSNSATLSVLLDGSPVKTFVFNADPAAKGANVAYRTTEFQKEYNVYRADYDRDVAVPVPAGVHTISLDVTSGDWLSLSSYTLTHYLSSSYLPLRIMALGNGRTAFLWAQNKASDWRNAYDKKTLAALPASESVLSGLPDGAYEVVWTDTWTGKRLSVYRTHSHGGSLPLAVPAIMRDAAARIMLEK